jgi:hypothetical protein
MPHGAWLHCKIALGSQVQHETNTLLMHNAPILRRSIGDEATRQHEFPDTDRLFSPNRCALEPHGGGREGTRLGDARVKCVKTLSAAL